jgi:hypothetical protein
MWYMYYVGVNFTGGIEAGQKQIKLGLATSNNGKEWIKCPRNPILTYNMSLWWEKGTARIKCLSTPSVVYNGSHWNMWYSSWSNDSKYLLNLAYSTDGENFTKSSNNPIMVPDVAWEGEKIDHPDVVWNPNKSIYEMFYVGQANPISLGYANSSDGKMWAKYESNPVLQKGNRGEWDDSWIYRAGVLSYANSTLILLNNAYRLYYSAYDGSKYWIGIANSPFNEK